MRYHSGGGILIMVDVVSAWKHKLTVTIFRTRGEVFACLIQHLDLVQGLAVIEDRALKKLLVHFTVWFLSGFWLVRLQRPFWIFQIDSLVELRISTILILPLWILWLLPILLSVVLVSSKLRLRTGRICRVLLFGIRALLFILRFAQKILRWLLRDLDLIVFHLFHVLNPLSLYQ